MSMKQKLQSRQIQSLALTPQMRQAIHILQLNNLELAEFLAEQVNENPFLETRENQDFDVPHEKAGKEGFDPGDYGPEENGSDPPDAAGETRDELDSAFKNGDLPDAHVSERFYENLWESDARPDLQNRPSNTFMSAGLPAHDPEKGNPGNLIEQNISAAPSFRDFVRQQIFDKMLENPLKDDCLTLIDWLDEEAYLTECSEELETLLDISRARVDAALEQLKSLVPTGVAASCLSERLSMQLKSRGLWQPDFDIILSHLDLLAKGEVRLLAKKSKIRPRVLMERIETIRCLDPKITSAFRSEAAQDKQPDILVSKSDVKDEENGGWQVELNDLTLPKILVLDRYWEELATRKMPARDREYLNNCYNSGNWLVKALNQRAITLLRVAREIVKQQTDFLEKGLDCLKPMTLRDIAVELELHESTVSRVTANKLMETPQGIVELKFFFSAGIAAKEGDVSHSARAVKERIRALVAAETNAGKGFRPKILSDAALAAALQRDGIDIARRTVAKYREAIGIPSSADRKRAARLLT